MNKRRRYRAKASRRATRLLRETVQGFFQRPSGAPKAPKWMTRQAHATRVYVARDGAQVVIAPAVREHRGWGARLRVYRRSDPDTDMVAPKKVS